MGFADKTKNIFFLIKDKMRTAVPNSGAINDYRFSYLIR